MQSVVLTLEAASRVKNDAQRGADIVAAKVKAQSAFFRAMSSWRLTERQTAALVWQGHEPSGRSHTSLFVFDEKLRPREVQMLERIAQILEVFLACRLVFEHDAASALWLKSPVEDSVFCKLTPLTWMIHGGHSGFKQVQDHLKMMGFSKGTSDPIEPT